VIDESSAVRSMTRREAEVERVPGPHAMHKGRGFEEVAAAGLGLGRERDIGPEHMSGRAHGKNQHDGVRPQETIALRPMSISLFREVQV